MPAKGLKKIFRYIPLLIMAAAAVTIPLNPGLVARRNAPFVSYSVSVSDFRLGLVDVTAKYRCSSDDKVSFRRVCGSSIEPISITARSDAGEELNVTRSGGCWTVFNDRGDFELSYQVILMSEDLYSPLVRKKLSLLHENRVRFFGIDLFLVPEKKVSQGILIDYESDSGSDLYSVYPNVGSRMILEESSQLGELMCVSGDYELRRESVGSTEIIFLISKGWAFSSDEIFSLIKDIVFHEVSLFGSSPHRRYLFVCDSNPVQGEGGFDYYGVHQGPNVLLLFDPHMKRSNLYDLNMAVIAHEFFHNWNGEALKPADETFMWFTEGVTVYYSYRVLLSLGIIDRARYRQKLDLARENYLQNPYRQAVPIADSGNSDMSDKNMVTLMYDGGFLAAAELDSYLQQISNGSVSLLDLLRSLYSNNSFGTEVDDKLVVDEARKLTGLDISEFLERLVHTPGSGELLGEDHTPGSSI